ncbi:DEAD/DEAH box helicase [Candidatus Babeliales bacterium]|nr:DEAD/DEAH box helicase [Candidatus Babeliales bacterium]
MNSVTFKDLGLSSQTLAVLEKKGFTTPTEIQSLVIPHALNSERDIIGKAATGTGKTAAFGLPLLDRIKEDCEHVQAVILAPTRELALQVCDELNSLKGNKRLNIIPVYGGASIIPQIKQLRRNCHIVVGTPGRVIDHLKRKTVHFKNIEYFVLDEADEMLNAGFLIEIKEILANANKDRKTLCFSATMPSAILKLTQQYMKNPLLLETKNNDDSKANVIQTFYEVKSSREKRDALFRLIDGADAFYGFIFCRTRREVDDVSDFLKEEGYPAEKLHGDISQSQRERVLKLFKAQSCTIIVGTDVAARGIDVKDLTHVVNFSLPQTPESYVHRIGRTGRAGKSGAAMTLVTQRERKTFQRMLQVLRLNATRENVPTNAQLQNRKEQQLDAEIKSLLKRGQHTRFEQLGKTLLEKYDAHQIVSGMAAMLLR